MTALLEKVLTQAYQVPVAEQDALAERLLQTLKEFQGEQGGKQEKPRPRFGSARGMFTLPPDFDALLGSFLDSEDGRTVLEAERPRARFGSARGLGCVTPDFEEPLEEFKEYTG